MCNMQRFYWLALHTYLKYQTYHSPEGKPHLCLRDLKNYALFTNDHRNDQGALYPQLLGSCVSREQYTHSIASLPQQVLTPRTNPHYGNKTTSLIVGNNGWNKWVDTPHKTRPSVCLRTARDQKNLFIQQDVAPTPDCAHTRRLCFCSGLEARSIRLHTLWMFAAGR